MLAQKSRVTPPGEETVEQRGEGDHEDGIEQHRHENEAEAHFMNDAAAHNGGEGGRATGWVHALQLMHGADGQAHGQGGGELGLWDEFGAKHADEGRDQMAHENGPRLRQLAMRHTKKKHGAGAHGGDQQFCARTTDGPFADNNKQADGKAAAQGRDELFAIADGAEFDSEQGGPGRHDEREVVVRP